MDKDIQINGISLISPRWNIQAIPENTPGRRGTNSIVPYSDGGRFVKKNYEQRTEILNMWVIPVDEYGNFPTNKSLRQQLEENVEYLKQIFCSSMGLLEYRKKMVNGTWRKASVEVTSVIEFQKPTETAIHKVFSVELHFPDPFYYDEIETSQIITPNAAIFSIIHNNKGTAMAKKMEIILSGGLVNPKISNEDLGIWVKINQAITVGNTVTINTETFDVKDNARNSLIHTLTHAGDPIWFILKPGNNNLKITCDSIPNGAVTLKYKAPYL